MLHLIQVAPNTLFWLKCKHFKLNRTLTGYWRVSHYDVIKWKHFPRYWPFVWGIPRSPVNSPHKGQWRGALMFSMIYVWINGWVNSREAGDLRRHHARYDVTVTNRPIVIWEEPHKGRTLFAICCVSYHLVSIDFTCEFRVISQSVGHLLNCTSAKEALLCKVGKYRTCR